MIQELPPPTALFRMASGFYVSRALYVSAKLGIADLLAPGPRAYGEVGEGPGTPAPSLRRVLRLLTSVAVFFEEADGRFTLTPIGACLQADVPGSMHAAVLLFGGITEKAGGDLLYSVETGEPAFHHVFGMDSFSS